MAQEEEQGEGYPAPMQHLAMRSERIPARALPEAARRREASRHGHSTRPLGATPRATNVGDQCDESKVDTTRSWADIVPLTVGVLDTR